MAELRAQIAELTLEKAAYAGFASCTRRTARHVPYSVRHICSMPHVMPHAPATRRSAHQHLPCSPSTAVMPASIAKTGGESAARTCHAAMRWKTPCATPPVRTSCATQVCGPDRRTDGAVFTPRGGQYEARCSVRRQRERDRAVGCIPARRYPEYHMKLLCVSCPITSSIHMSTQSTVCEHQECPCEYTSTRVVLEVPM